MSRPAIAAGTLKLRAEAWKTQLPARSTSAARISATSVTIDSSSTISVPWKVRTSLGWRGQGDGAVGVVAPGQAALGDQRADAGGGEEGADAGAARAQPLGERALRGQLDGELTGEVLPAELLVLPDVGRDDPGDPAGLEQQAEPGAVDAAVVGHDGQVVGALLEQGAR